jgi:hypothetical protein
MKKIQDMKICNTDSRLLFLAQGGASRRFQQKVDSERGENNSYLYEKQKLYRVGNMYSKEENRRRNCEVF